MKAKKTEVLNAGVTLLEMMVVLTIMGILSAIAVTNYVITIDKSKVKGDVRALEQTIQIARMHAISGNVPHGIVFNRDDKSYFIFRDNAGAAGGGGDGAFTDDDANPGNNAFYDKDPDHDSDYDVNDENYIIAFLNTRDLVLEAHEGAGGEFRFWPHRLSNRNRFTCIFNDSNINGTFSIVFDPMGRVTPNVGRNISVVMIQTDTGARVEQKPRGFVFINPATGLTDSVLSQPFTTEPTTWCSTDINP
jgi:prepilin-type N-terminal cleavage/methylation domain-containing protein